MPRFTLSPDGEAVLRRAVESIQANLPLWDQDYYVVDEHGRAGRGRSDNAGPCETTACLAGWIVSNELKLSLPELLVRYENFNGAHIEIGDLALDLLGLPECDDSRCPDPEDFEGHSCDSAFRHAIFYATDFNGRTPGAFVTFVDYLSTLTGIDFELAR